MAAKFMAPIATIMLVAMSNYSDAGSGHLHNRTHHQTHSERAVDANSNAAIGVVRSTKTGATARVLSRYAAAFQAYVDDLEDHGARIAFMGGYRRGRCASDSLHPCGKALDVCQLSRGRVDARCHLPSRQTIAAIAERHGLFEGGQWCQSDYGHAQVGTTAEACRSNRQTTARRVHRNKRYAKR